MRRLGLAALAALACLAVLAPRQAAAEAQGVYPSALYCDVLPFESGPMRDTLSVTISSGRASYSRRLSAPDPAGAVEAGSGTLSGRTLVLSGRAQGKGAVYTARYSGQIDGRGGFLSGVQTWTRGGKTYRRACQMTLGNGRG